MPAKGFTYPYQRLALLELYAKTYEPYFITKYRGDATAIHNVTFNSKEVTIQFVGEFGYASTTLQKKTFMEFINECIVDEWKNREKV